jgi:hypothetical protein
MPQGLDERENLNTEKWLIAMREETTMDRQ